MPNVKDGVIQIGFETDVSSFVKEIKKELSSVKDWGLSDSIKDEIDDINRMLDGLSKSFSEGMNSKLDTKTFAGFEKKISAEMQVIDKRVTALEDSMQALVTTMDSADSSKISSFLGSVGNQMESLKGTTDTTVEAVKELVNISAKSGGAIKLADNSSIEELQKEKKILHEIADGLVDLGSVKLYKNRASSQIDNYVEQLKNARLVLKQVKESGNNLEIARAERDVVKFTQRLRELQSQSSEVKWSNGENPFSKIIDYLTESEAEVSRISDSVSDRLLQIGKTAKNLGKSSAASMNKDQSEIKIPIIPDITKEDFWPKVRGIIEYTQKSVDKNPIEIGFVLSSKMSSKNTNKLLKEWQEKVATIDDDQLRGEFESLYDQLAKDVSKGIHINVDSNLKEESDKIRDGVSELQKMLGGKIKVFPQFTISERQTKKLQTELNKASKGLTLTINNFELKEKGKKELSKNIEEISTLRDAVDNLNSKLEKMGDTPLSSIYDSLTKIFDIVTRLETPIHEIANSIKHLGIGLRTITDFSPSVDLDGMFSSMADSISTIHGKLGKVKGGENPLITQLKQIAVAYKEYQKLGGEKSLADLGGDANVQNWLKKHENDDFSGVVSDIVNQYIGEIKKDIPLVQQASEELIEVPKEVIEQEQPETSRVAEALAEKFGDTLSDAFINQREKVKNALKSLLLDNILSLVDLSSDSSMFATLSDEVYREWVEAINAKAKLESKGKLKAKVLSQEEEEERKGRWAESLSELGLNSKYARLDFKELKNLTDIAKIKTYYQQLTDLVSRLNVEIKSDRGSSDLKEFVSKINDVIVYFDNQIKETEKANSTLKKKTRGKSNYKRLTAKDLEEDSVLSASTWEAYRHLKKQDKKDLFLQIASMFKEYQNNSDEEVLNAIKQLVDESDFSKSLKAKFSDELVKATKNQKNDIAKASDELVSEYAEGMESAKPEAKKAGENIGEAAIEGVQEVTDTHSPSKVAEKLGEYFGEGYANGILKGRAKVKNAIRALFEESLITLDDIKNDTDNGRFSVDALTEIKNGKKPTKQAKDYQKQIKELFDESASEIYTDADLKNLGGVGDLSSVIDATNARAKETEVVNKDVLAHKDLAKAKEEVNDVYSDADIKDIGVGDLSAVVEATNARAKEKGIVEQDISAYKELADVKKDVDDTYTDSDLVGGYGDLTEVFEATNKASVQANKFAEAIYDAENSSLGYLENIKLSVKAQQGSEQYGLREAIKNKTYNLQEPVDFNHIFDDFIEDSRKAYKNVHLVTNELGQLSDVASKDNALESFIGSVRTQIGDATSDAYTFVRTFKNIIDETISHRLVKQGDDLVPKDFSEIRIDYKKLEDEIIKSDNKILELSHQIANATEDEATPLRENLRLLDDELNMYEEILKYMVSDDYYKYDESSLNSFIQRRDENKTFVGNKYKSKEIAEENKNLEKQNLLNKQIQTQMSNLLVLRAKLEKQGLSTGGIDKLFDSLSNIDDKNAFSMWLEDLKQFKNEIKLLMPELDEWGEKLKKINAQQSKTLGKDFKESISEISSLNPSGVDWKKEYTNGKGEWIGALAAGTTSYDSLLDKYHELIVARKELNKFEELAAKNPEIYTERLQEAKDVLSAILGDIKTIETDTYLDSLTDEQLVNLANIKTKFEDIVRLSEAANNNVAEKQAQDSQKIWDRINKANEQALNKALSSFNQFGNKEFQKSFIPELQSEIDALKIEFQRLIDMGSNEEIIPKAEIDAAVKSLQRLSKEVLDTNKYYAETKDVTNLYSKIAGFMDNNTAMARNFKKELQGILDVLKSGGQITEQEFTELESHFNRISGQVKELHQTGNSLFASFKKQLKSANAQFLTTYFSLQDFIRYGREAFNTIKELDYALVDLKKTTTMSSSELDEFYYGASETARQMGVTTKEIIDQASAWSRLGYSSKDAATEMAALSSQFAQISPGMDVETATDGLVSVMKAFHVDVSNVERDIMDVINKTGNTMATNNEEIVEMLERSSAAMSAANNTIEETIALESAAVQITRNAETTGTAFRTISMRIRGKQSLPPYAVMYMLCA